MTLKSGTRVGPYEILSPIAAGGMGEVYLARDRKLGRDVALKTLPEAFASDEDRLVRFRREAQMLATMNHPNIAAIYGLEESAGAIAIALELVEGATLADRIRAGAIPVDEALAFARQIAEALEAAHQKNVLHRDLKPANIKITPAGNVKVLDFGLAKILEPPAAGEGFSNSPTIMSATGAGVILGTAGYMSPEQARGNTVDKRTDIWAFGVVLFEMLAGKRLYDGETITDILGAILHKDPDWGLLPPDTPPGIRRLLRRCLARDARQRLHDIADARLEIDAASSEDPVEISNAAPAQPVRTRFWVFAGMMVAVIAAAAFMSGRWTSGEKSGDATLSTEILPPVKPFKEAIPAPVLSPDGRTLAFSAPDAKGKNVLWVRPLDSPDARALPGTEGVLESFWSPDGHALAFLANGKLQRIDIASGDPQFIADAPSLAGGTWAKDGTILFVPTATTVHRVQSSGGTPKEVTRLDAARHELIHGWPSFLPDGKHFLVWVFSSERQNEGVYIGALDSGELSPLLPDRSRAQYANGHVFFGRQGNLMAQRFDPDKLQLSGEPKRVAGGLGLSFGEIANFAFSASDSGTIVWSDRRPIPKSQPTWFSRKGDPAGTIGEPGIYFGVTPSPDGKYAATEFVDLVAQTGDIQLLDLAGGNSLRLTFVNYWAGNPIWSADSQRVLFTQYRDHVDVISIHGGAIEQVPFPGGTNSDFPMGLSADGQSLLLQRLTATGSDLWILPISGNHKPRPYIDTPVNELDGRISPDGRWIAYATDESGRFEVFVQSFPVPGSKKRISVNGGAGPVWRKDGRELYFVTDDHALMAVNVTSGRDSLEFSPPTRLFVQKDLLGGVGTGGRVTYAPALDGMRFLILVPLENERPEVLHLINNWKP